MNDNIAFHMAEALAETISKLPTGLYMLGDAAYTLSEHLLIPFTGSQRENADNDAFNYHLSQLRIRIEMAFGRLVNKFRILKKNLEGKTMKINARIIMACAILHNFIIDQDVPEDKKGDDHDDIDVDNLGIIPMLGSPLGMVYHPTIIEDDFEELEGFSQTRLALADFIRTSMIRRPAHNIQRNSGRIIGATRVIEPEFFHPA